MLQSIFSLRGVYYSGNNSESSQHNYISGYKTSRLSSYEKVHFQINKTSPMIVFRGFKDESNGDFMLYSRAEVNLTKLTLLPM